MHEENCKNCVACDANDLVEFFKNKNWSPERSVAAMGAVSASIIESVVGDNFEKIKNVIDGIISEQDKSKLQ